MPSPGLPDPTGAVPLLKHALALQDRLLSAQDEFLAAANDAMKKFGGNSGSAPAAERKAMAARLQGFKRLVRGLEAQLRAVMDRLKGTDPSSWPADMRLRVQSGMRQVQENFQTIQVRVSELRDKIGSGDGDLPEESDLPSGEEDEEDADPDETGVPESPEDVGEAIAGGEYETADDVVTVFERLDDAPRGNLRNFLRYRKGNR